MFLSSSTVEIYSLAFMLICSGICFIPPLLADRGYVWNSVIMAHEGASATLSCFESPPASSVLVTWKVMPVEGDRWSYLLSAKCNHGWTDGHKSIVFEDRTFEISTDASLIFKASAPGLYNCVIEHGDKRQQEKTVLLALVKLTVTPAPPVMVHRTLRLTAQVSPPSVDAWGTWVSPWGERLYTEITRATGVLLSKLPRVTSRDNGVYTCRIGVHGNSGTSVSEHRMNVTVNGKVFSFTDLTHEKPRSMASISHSLVTLSCPPVLGDYVLLYWEYPDSTKMELIFQFNRWRRSLTNRSMPHLHLIEPTTLAAAGNFSFLLKPALKDGGRYLCEVFLDDKAFSQDNRLSVLHGYTKRSPSSLDLTCSYSQRSQVRLVRWSHVQNPSRPLQSAGVIGRIKTSVALPVTPETAGEYACTLYLKNGNSVQYIYSVQMSNIGTTVVPGSAVPPAADNVSTSSRVSTLSLLLFVIPMIAIAVGVLLWRQGYCITRRSVEQSLSRHSGEVENIYENPDDLRQTSPQGAVYMDLKPTGEMDVYKELDRYDQCCS
ncbi:g6f-like isoform X2 [Triplophysa rosa]|uniref:g6f-like isoform X2 n=1 Tax=Triplophysa rosa TaxID=992332 RepID=UPI002546097E|nr:g6f-like isoform X2 [Triplophysa rosa]